MSEDTEELEETEDKFSIKCICGGSVEIVNPHYVSLNDITRDFLLSHALCVRNFYPKTERIER